VLALDQLLLEPLAFGGREDAGVVVDAAVGRRRDLEGRCGSGQREQEDGGGESSGEPRPQPAGRARRTR
jgi:hypothetical protein